MSFRDIAAILKKKEAAAVNDGSSGSGNGIVAMDNQQQQIGNGALGPIKNPPKLTNFLAKVRLL